MLAERALRAGPEDGEGVGDGAAGGEPRVEGDQEPLVVDGGPGPTERRAEHGQRAADPGLPEARRDLRERIVLGGDAARRVRADEDEAPLRECGRGLRRRVAPGVDSSLPVARTPWGTTPSRALKPSASAAMSTGRRMSFSARRCTLIAASVVAPQPPLAPRKVRVDI